MYKYFWTQKWNLKEKNDSIITIMAAMSLSLSLAPTPSTFLITLQTIRGKLKKKTLKNLSFQYSFLKIKLSMTYKLINCMKERDWKHIYTQKNGHIHTGSHRKEIGVLFKMQGLFFFFR